MYALNLVWYQYTSNKILPRLSDHKILMTGNCRNNVRFTVGFQKFPHLPQYKLADPITLEQARKLMLVMYVHLIIQIYEHRHA